MKIVGVAILDVAVVGRDVFFVQEGPDAVVQYEVDRAGKVTPISPTLPMISVMASVEKFNHGYLIEPIELGSLSQLVGYLGRFEPVSDTRARLRGKS